jgi:hypothetical protein
MAGTSWDDTNRSLTITGATVTTSNPVFNITQTWNAGGVTFTGLKFNATDTSSASDSLLADLQVGGTSQFKFKKDAFINFGGNFWLGKISAGSAAGFFTNALNGYYAVGASGFVATSAGTIGFSSSNTPVIADTILTRSAAATLQLGAADAASPVAQTIQAQGSRTSTDTNVGGANLTIQSGKGTGTGTPSVLYLKSPVPVGSGSGAQTMTTGLAINYGTAVLSSYTVSGLPAASSAGAGALAYVTDANATTARSTVAGGGSNKVVCVSDGTNWTIVA